jgi:hypothetical protein
MEESFKEQRNELSDAEKFVMAFMYTWGVWNTSDLHIVAIDNI